MADELADPELPLRCPTCGTRFARLGEYVWRTWDEFVVKDGVVTIYPSDKVDWDTSVNAAVVDRALAGESLEGVLVNGVAGYCSVCDKNVPLPDDVEIDWA